MSTMLEKMTAAIDTELGKQEMVLTDPLTLRRMMAKRAARAALHAIREPGDAILASACKTHKPGEPMSEARPEECHMISRRRKRFTAMIDAILSAEA